jgi:sodium pump decarboxylase gamma subunit
MTIFEMLQQSGIMALLGVGTVSMFFISLIICITLMSKLINVFNKNEHDTTTKKQPNNETSAIQGEVISAITAAVNEYKK